MIGLGCLGLGFIFLVIWSLVWMVAAQVSYQTFFLLINILNYCRLLRNKRQLSPDQIHCSSREFEQDYADKR